MSYLSPIRYISADLEVMEVKIPVADIIGMGRGATLLVTAGMDGDEYAGIEAAYVIIERYKNRKFNGRLIVLPVVNTFGFESGVSWNPKDGKFPKNIFPGKNNGSSSERLIYWLFKTYILQSDVWLDLHGGASNERLMPFIWAYQTRNADINSLVGKILGRIQSERTIFEGHPTRPHAKLLAPKNISYLMSEAGEMGQRKKIWRQFHEELIASTMIALRMKKVKQEETAFHFFQRVQIIKSDSYGLWYPLFPKTGKIASKDKIGIIYSLDKKDSKVIYADRSSIFLWGKNTMNCRQGDELMVLAYDKRVFEDRV